MCLGTTGRKFGKAWTIDTFTKQVQECRYIKHVQHLHLLLDWYYRWGAPCGFLVLEWNVLLEPFPSLRLLDFGGVQPHQLFEMVPHLEARPLLQMMRLDFQMNQYVDVDRHGSVPAPSGPTDKFRHVKSLNLNGPRISWDLGHVLQWFPKLEHLQLGLLSYSGSKLPCTIIQDGLRTCRLTLRTLAIPGEWELSRTLDFRSLQKLKHFAATGDTGRGFFLKLRLASSVREISYWFDTLAWKEYEDVQEIRAGQVEPMGLADGWKDIAPGLQRIDIRASRLENLERDPGIAALQKPYFLAGVISVTLNVSDPY